MRVTLYRSVTNVATDSSRELTWAEFVELLSVHERRDDKDGPGFSPATFRPGASRTDDAVTELHALVFDIDKAADGTPLDLDAALASLQRIAARGVRFVWHTTHSHAPPHKATLRVAIELSRPVPASEWRAFYSAAAADLGIAYERKCVNPARFWYLPSAPVDSTEAEAGTVDGVPLDVEAINVEAPTTNPERISSSLEDRPASPEVLAEVQRYLALHGPAIEGQGGDQHTYRAAAIARNDFALSDAEALAVLTVWDAGNRPPWGIDGLREKMENSSRYAQNERGAARIAFEEQREFSGNPVTPPPAPEPGSWAHDLAKAKADVIELLSNMPAEGVAPEPLFESAQAIVGRSHPPTPWLLRGLMTRGGTTMISGGPKSSKTWAEIEIFIAVTTATKAFGEFEGPAEPLVGALFLAEDDAAAFTTRASATAKGRGMDLQTAMANLYVQPRGRTIDLLKIDDVALVVASCRRIKRRVGLVGLDPLRDIHSGEEDKSDDMSTVMRHARAIGILLGGAGVVLVHHSKKPEKDGGGGPATGSGGHKMRGSSAIHGSVDSGIYIHGVKGDGTNVFVNRMESQVKAGRSTGMFTLTLTIEDDDHGKAITARWKFEKREGEAPDAKDEKRVGAELVAQILEAVGDREHTLKELAMSVGGNKQVRERALQQMVNDGKLFRVLDLFGKEVVPWRFTRKRPVYKRQEE